MANRKVKDYIAYCNEKKIKINSEESLEQYRRDKLVNQNKLSTKASRSHVASISNHFKNVSKTKNGGQEVVAKSVKEFDNLNKSSKATRELYKKNYKRIAKIAHENNICDEPNPKNLSKEQYEQVKKIMEDNFRAKGKSDEQIEGLMKNYNQAFNFANREMGPKTTKEQKLRQAAEDFWNKPSNAQKFLPVPKEGIDEKLIERTMKMMREHRNMVANNKIIGSKKTCNDYPKHLRNYMRYLLAYTNRDSMYTTKTKDFCGFITAMQEFGLSASVQQNAPTAVRFYANKSNWKYKDTIPKTNIGLGADERIFAKIDNSATINEIEKAKDYFKNEGKLPEYYTVSLASISLRIEELTDEITLSKLEKALETGKFHVDDGKGKRPRDVELFNDRTRGVVQDLVDFMKANDVKGNPFAPGAILNPKGLDQRSLIKSLEAAIESSRHNFQDEDRVKRAELNKIYDKEEHKDTVIGRCFLTAHSFRAGYAVEAYEHYKQRQIDYLNKFGIEAMKGRMFEFYKKENERILKENEKREKEGKKGKKLMGNVFKNTDRDIIKYIERSSMLYASRQIGHNRYDVTRIYIAKVVGEMKKFVDLETFKEHFAA